MEEQTQLYRFYQAVLSLESPREAELFFRDLCTPKELQAMGQRLEVACQLAQGRNYLEIEESTGASSATISRVSKCLAQGGGYVPVLRRMEGN